MEFWDFEKIIRDNYPILIESYVKQYGEEYRGHITSVLTRTKFCIFETPHNLSLYVRCKKREDFMKVIIDSYLEFGIDISNIKIGEKDFVFKDKKQEDLTKCLFPIITSYDDAKDRGIFTFRDEFDDLEIDNQIFKERIEVLEKLNLKSVYVTVEDYIKTDDYRDNCKRFKKFLNFVLERVFYRCSDDYDRYLKYVNELESKIRSIAKKYEREFFIQIREYLSKSDLELLDKGCIKELDAYGLYFDDSLEKDYYDFSFGLLEYFCDYCTEILMSKHASSEDKKEIFDMRLKYLERRGYDISKLDFDGLLCDWYDVDYLKGYLPDVQEACDCLLKRDLVQEQYEKEAAQLCIINDYLLDDNDSLIDTIMNSNGHSCLFDSSNCFDFDNPIPIICISPLDEVYNLFDISLDHELRHAIEMSIKKKKNGYEVKVGSDISILDDDFCCVKEGFTTYNERVTQKLSVEATRDRWMNGQYIFSDVFALITDYAVSCYDSDFDNLDIIFEPFRDELIKSQISNDFNYIYHVIPKNILRKIDLTIDKHSKKSVERLHQIRDELLLFKDDKVKKYK